MVSAKKLLERGCVIFMANYGMGVVGEKDAVLAFRALGMEVIDAVTANEVALGVHQLVQQGIRVIFITEAAARIGSETLEKYYNDPNVTIIPIPGTTGTDGLGLKQVRSNVEKAIGADILFKDQQNNEEKEG